MKKIKYLVLALLLGVLVTGCGSSNKTLKCTNKKSLDSIEYEATYEIVYDKNDFVKEVTTIETVVSEDEEYLEQAKESAEQLYKEANDAYGGYSFTVSISGNKMTSKCTIDYTKMDVKKYVEDSGLTDFADSDNNVKLSGVTSIYKNLGAKCEE